jgi:hypothetical protein
MSSSAENAGAQRNQHIKEWAGQKESNARLKNTHHL